MYRVGILFIALGLLLCGQTACQQASSGPPEVATASSPAPDVAPTASTGPGEMKSTPSGLQYQDIEIGEGRRPLWGEVVGLKYVGKLADGKVFEEGKLDHTLGEKGIIKGFNIGVGGGEGIDAMKLYGKRVIVLPPELAYGEAGNPPKVPPQATITFELELVKMPKAAIF